MASLSVLQIPLGLIALGTLFLAVAWVAITEYWRAFRADPQAVMSLEVLANILKLGGPGYLAMLAIVAGLAMLLGGTVALLFLAGFWVVDLGGTLINAIGASLGFK